MGTVAVLGREHILRGLDAVRPIQERVNRGEHVSDQELERALCAYADAGARTEAHPEDRIVPNPLR